MSDCQRCGGRANDAFLCRTCQAALTEHLSALPWLQHRLTEAALGQTKMSDNGGRKSAPRAGLDGDKPAAAYIEPLPTIKGDDDDLSKARKAREKLALSHALATGGINARASELLATIADALGYWCRVLCEARGLTYAPPVIANRPIAFGEAHAIWLLGNVAVIALSEEADDIAGEIEDHVSDIVRVINRPVRYWALGDCPGWIDKEYRECQADLRVVEGTEEVQCRQCGTRHDVHRLLLSRKYEADGKPMTWRQMRRYNRELPPEFQAPMRTLEHWLKTGKLPSCGDVDGDPL